MKINLLLLLISWNVFAADSNLATANVGDDFLKCSAFYTIDAIFFEDDALSTNNLKKINEDKKEVKDFSALASRYESYSQTLTKRSPTATIAMHKLFVEQMEGIISHDYNNIAILVEQYGNFCKSLETNPEQRLHYWLKQQG